ncbi:MAG: hypothetical protein ACRDS0_22340 [Pseudonocardiaceae bacterium]
MPVERERPAERINMVPVQLAKDSRDLVQQAYDYRTSHRMDLTRVALHYSFLADGQTPYRQVKGTKLAKAVPDYLTGTQERLDIARCSRELINAGHDAGILDNVAYASVHGVLEGHSSGRYERWLQHHRADRVSVTGDVDVQLRLASVGPDLDALDYTSRMVERARRYAEIRPYELGLR